MSGPLSRVLPSSDTSEYEPLEHDELLGHTTDETRHGSEESNIEDISSSKQIFSWHDYTVFLILGVAMLWAWYVHKHHRRRPPAFTGVGFHEYYP